FRPDPLIGVDLEDPRAAAGGDPGVAPPALAFPGALDDVIGEPPRDLARAVLAAIEHDDELVGEAEPRQAFGELRLLVARDDERRQTLRPGNRRHGGRRLAGRDAHCPALATAGSPAVRRHSWRAAALAISTE